MPHIDAQERPLDTQKRPLEPPDPFLQSQNVPPAVVRSARRKHRKGEPPPSRAQTQPVQNLEENRTRWPASPGTVPQTTRAWVLRRGSPGSPSPPKFSMDPDTFFEYWGHADLMLPNRGTVYVYRTWPMIDRQRIDPDAKKYIDKMDKAPENPALWRQEILHRYGSGNYKLILNDAGGSTKAVGQTLIADLRDPDYPPVINSLDELVMDDPSNQSFLENLRQKGILPGERELAKR